MKISSGFKEYVKKSRKEFSEELCKVSLNAHQRVPIENILIAFDQMANKLGIDLNEPIEDNGSRFLAIEDKNL
jgi:hypothetical protein